MPLARGNVVVTGGSAGVGRAVVERFAREGYNVAVLARGQKSLDGTVAAIETHGVKGRAFKVDVADFEAVKNAADTVASEWNGIDIWVNCAMVTIFAEIGEIKPEEFRRVTEVTYLGQVHGTLAALPIMKRQGHGTIVHIGSALGYRSVPLQGPYCAAKSAVRAFVDSLRCEFLHDGTPIRLTIAQLPAVNTPQFDWARNRLKHRLQPVPPIYQPEAIAREIVRAAHEAPRELWIGTSSWKAILGNMIAPGLADRYLARTAYQGETTSQPAVDERSDNLYDAVDEDPGAHGRFDHRAQNHVIASDPVWLKLGLAAAGGLAAAALGAASARAGDRRQHETRTERMLEHFRR